MKATLLRDFEMTQYDPVKGVNFPKGVYEIERIPNPFWDGGEPWLVIAGTKTGTKESTWRSFAPGQKYENGNPIDLGNLTIVIED